MKNITLVLALLLVAAAPAVADHRAEAEKLVAGWPEPSRMAGQAMLQAYGAPTELTPTQLIWRANGPWVESILSKEPVDHHFPMKHQDVLEQVVYFEVPEDKFDELAAYDGSVIVERTKGTLSARCDKEPMNYLALNLAHDIISGKRSVEDARAFYAKTAMAFKEGKKDPYTQGLLFRPGTKAAGDPDQPAPMAAKTGG